MPRFAARTETPSPLTCTTAVGNPARDTACPAASAEIGLDVANSTSRPPVNSTPKFSPRAASPATATAATVPATASHTLPARMSCGFLRVSQVLTAPAEPKPDRRGPIRPMTAWASTRVMSMAETSEASTPTASVTPKPFTGPEASQNSSPAAIRVVTLESAIALQAFLNPRSSAPRSPRRGACWYSSLARSKTSTLASMAMPMASTNPASPGSVNVAPIATSAAYEITP